MGRIKIGQIGVCHEHAGDKMDALRKLPEIFEVVGVVDDRGSKAAKFAGHDLRPYEGLRWLTEEELLRTPGLQAVMVETPNGDLVPTAMTCLDRGLAMHMDKPGGEVMEPFEMLRRRCEKEGVPFQMGYMFRGNPAMQWCVQAIRDGWLGEVFEVQGSMSHNYGGEEYQAYIGQFPGGIMYNLGCHLVDLIVTMLGRPQAVTPFLRAAPSEAAEIKNNCLTVMEYAQATATLRACSREVGGLPRRSLKICGTGGSVELCPLERFDGQPLTMRLTLREPVGTYGAGVQMVDFGVIDNRYTTQLRNFAGMIEGSHTTPYTYTHDCLVQEVVLAASGYTRWNSGD